MEKNHEMGRRMSFMKLFKLQPARNNSHLKLTQELAVNIQAIYLCTFLIDIFQKKTLIYH